MVKCSDFSSRLPTEDKKWVGRPGVIILKIYCKQLLYNSMQVPLKMVLAGHSKAALGTCLPLSLKDPHQGAPGTTLMLGSLPKGVVQILCSLMAPRSLILPIVVGFELWDYTAYVLDSVLTPHFILHPILGTAFQETVPSPDPELRLAQHKE